MHNKFKISKSEIHLKIIQCYRRVNETVDDW